MAEGAPTRYPEYVTDGSHIYLWHEEFEPLFTSGRLRASDPPVRPLVKTLSQREKTKIDAIRRKAIADAENTLKAFQSVDPSKNLEDLFGTPPQQD